jgi:2-polyprenyl-6-methoxyphenol hydroxylase-like FAD-dependent oxidoreductase
LDDGTIQQTGEAAHAVLPNAGQGACMAVEDTYVLARWLSKQDNPADAFRQFDRIRHPTHPRCAAPVAPQREFKGALRLRVNDELANADWLAATALRSYHRANAIGRE